MQQTRQVHFELIYPALLKWYSNKRGDSEVWLTVVYDNVRLSDELFSLIFWQHNRNPNVFIYVFVLLCLRMIREKIELDNQQSSRFLPL